MLKFDKLFALIAALAVISGIAAAYIISNDKQSSSRKYMLEVSRVEQEIRTGHEVSADDHDYITDITVYSGQKDFFTSASSYVIRDINGQLYRIDYNADEMSQHSRILICTELIIAAVFAAVLLILLYIRKNIIKPFNHISELPYELSKGNITAPLTENKSRYFGKFTWGLDMLREQIENSKVREIEHIRNEKTLLLSLSHDIKTPLSAVKLYSEAIEKGLYPDIERCRNAAKNISEKVDVIESYVKDIISNTSSSVIDYEITACDVYQSDVMEKVLKSYKDRFEANGTQLKDEVSTDCLLHVDPDRLAEVLQNILDNAIKYGDGKLITITYNDEESCRLITVSNSGCTLPESELSHIFNSFWRGSNTGSKPGSGLGLYICRKLMNDMLGEVFAEIKNDYMCITVVCPKS